MQIVLDIESKAAGPLTNLQIGYVFFRIYVGANLFFHGFMRFATSLDEWEMREAASFADTFLPMPLVHLALYMIPYVQVFLGTCIVIGLFTWWALIGGLCLFFILLFGHVVRMNWSGAHTVMHYGVYYWVLLALLTQNRLALDRLREKEP
jgi:uncharacterized membrane protein YphA (DoxX/SURF4 family)